MRTFLILCLAILMLTPSLACAMPICVDVAPQGMMKSSHHADMAGEHSKANPIEVPGLMKDCMGVDLQFADASDSLKKPEIRKAPFLPVMNGMLTTQRVASRAARDRGGPPDWLTLCTATSLPILLTTQRRLI